MNYLHNTKIILVYGVPGAGKSRLCSKLRKALDCQTKNILYLELDYFENIFLEEQIFLDDKDVDTVISRATQYFSELAKKEMLEPFNPEHCIELLIKALITAAKQVKGLAGSETSKTRLEGQAFSPPIWNVIRNFVPFCLPLIIPERRNLTSDIFIMVDDNFLLKSFRKVYIKIARSLRCGFSETLVEASLQESFDNNQSREGTKRVEKDVIINAFSKLEEGIFNSSLTFRSNKIEDKNYFDIFMLKLMSTLAEGMEPREEISQAERDEEIRLIKENISHQVDLAIRDINGLFLGGKHIDFIIEGEEEIKKIIENNKSKRKEIAQIFTIMKKSFMDFIFPQILHCTLSSEELEARLKETILGKVIKYISSIQKEKELNLSQDKIISFESYFGYFQKNRLDFWDDSPKTLKSAERMILIKKSCSNIYILTIRLVFSNY